MEKEGASTDSAKRMMELEAEISWLKKENWRLSARNAVPEKPNLDDSEEKDEAIFKLRGEVMAMKRTKEMWKAKFVKSRDESEEKDELIVKLEEEIKAIAEMEEILKDKYVKIRAQSEEKEELIFKLEEEVNAIKEMKANLKEKLESGEMKWSEGLQKKFMQNGGPQSSDEARKKRLEEDETMKVSNGKMAMEAKEKKISELAQRIEVLEKKNREMKAKVCHGNGEKSEVVKREEGENKILKLVTDRMGILVTEKRGLEEEIKQKGEAIKVLKQENDRLNDMIKNMKMETDRFVVKLEGDVESSQQDIANNVGILGNPMQIEGQKSAGFPHSDEHERSLNHGVTGNIHVKKEGEMSNANACKLKRPLPRNLTGGKSCGDAVALSSNGNSSIAKRLRSTIKRS